MAETSEYHNFFEVKAGQTRRTVSIRDQLLQTTEISAGDAGILKFSLKSPEFSALLKLGTQLTTLTALDCKVVLVEDSEGKHYVKLSATDYLVEFEVFYEGVSELAGFRKTVTVRNLAPKSIVLLDLAVDLLECEKNPAASRGGKGQPLFLGPFFAGVEFPTGENILQNQTIVLRHFPGETLQPDQIYTSFPVVWGSITKGTAEEAFQDYLTTMIRRPANKPLGIYMTWAAHDELNDKKTELTQALGTRMVSILQAWQKRGISFPYFLLDYQWYEMGARDMYLSFKKKNWPNGAESFLESLKAAGLKLGLWFDTSGLRVIGPLFPGFVDDGLEMLDNVPPNMENVARSRIIGTILRAIARVVGRGKTTVPCLIEGDFALKLQKAWEYWAREKGMQLIKLDFSRFECNNPYHEHLPGKHSEEQAIRKFADLLGQVREINPEMVLLAYNGYTEGLAWIDENITSEGQYAVSPWWLSHVDMVYCGDPRPSAVPTPHLRHSIMCYTDYQVRQFHNAGLPWRGIDDSGVLLGNTSAIYHLGKEDWRDAWVMGLCRGHLNPMLYGDLTLLEEEDAEFLRATMDLFNNNVESFAHPRPIGGNPARGEAYGWLCQSSKGGLSILLLHNPGFLPCPFNFGNMPAGEWQQLYPTHQPVRPIKEFILPPSAVILFAQGPITIPTTFCSTQLYSDGNEIPLTVLKYIRGPRERRIAGLLTIPKITRLQEIFIVIELKKALLPWRKVIHPVKQLPLQIIHGETRLPVHPVMHGKIWSATSWCAFTVDCKSVVDPATLSFEIGMPWEPGVRAQISAYVLTRSEK